MRRARELAAPAGPGQEIERWIASMDALRFQTEILFQDLPVETIARLFPESRNSIGTLLVHIAEAEAFWILEQAGGRVLSEERRELYRMELFGRPGAGQTPAAPASYFSGLLVDLRHETREILRGLTDADLDGRRIWTDPLDAQRQEIFNVRWILNHLLLHEAHHKGQIALLREISGAHPPPILIERRETGRR